MAVTGKIAEALTGARLMLRGAMGADLYEKYLDHMRRNVPNERPMTEREFWRDKTDRQEHNPEGRCC